VGLQISLVQTLLSLQTKMVVLTHPVAGTQRPETHLEVTVQAEALDTVRQCLAPVWGVPGAPKSQISLVHLLLSLQSAAVTQIGLHPEGGVQERVLLAGKAGQAGTPRPVATCVR
jgi:hypothetical protein